MRAVPLECFLTPLLFVFGGHMTHISLGPSQIKYTLQSRFRDSISHLFNQNVLPSDEYCSALSTSHTQTFEDAIAKFLPNRVLNAELPQSTLMSNHYCARSALHCLCSYVQVSVRRGAPTSSACELKLAQAAQIVAIMSTRSIIFLTVQSSPPLSLLWTFGITLPQSSNSSLPFPIFLPRNHLILHHDIFLLFSWANNNNSVFI